MKKRKKKFQKINIEDVKEAKEDETLARKLKNNNALDLEFFAIDTVGSTKGQSKSVRKQLAREKKIPKENRLLSKSTLKSIEKARNYKAPVQKKAEPKIYDLWDAPATEAIKKPKHIGQKSSLAPAVVLPEPGQAVNPAPSAHKELIFKAAADEMQQTADQLYITRKIRPMTAILIDEFGKEAVYEMDDATRIAKYTEITRIEREAADDSKLQGPGKKERKTQAQRNKRERHLQRLRDQREGKTKKMFEKALSQLPQIVKEIKKEEEERQEKRDYIDQLKKIDEADEKKGIVRKPKKIGRIAYKESALDVPLEENSTLRGVKPAIVASERINSFYRRNLLEQRAENSRLTLRRLKLQTRKQKKKRKFASSLQRDMMI